jgi:general stress protein YciG
MNYRKIWERHHGPIPVDEFGVSYEIHHIDGDRTNNDLSNLSCVSIVEHFSIHHSQGDWQAAERILQKIKDIERLRELGWTPKTYAQWQRDNKLGLWSPEIQTRALKTKREKGVGFCHDPKWAAIGGKLGGKKGAAITNEIHKKNGTGVYSKEHQSNAGKRGGAIAGKIPKSDDQKAAIKEGMKEVWRLRKAGLLPPRKPRTPKDQSSSLLQFED